MRDAAKIAQGLGHPAPTHAVAGLGACTDAGVHFPACQRRLSMVHCIWVMPAVVAHRGATSGASE